MKDQSPARHTAVATGAGWTVLPGVAVLIMGAIATLLAGGPAIGDLQAASGGREGDQDADGLCDSLEAVLGTRPDLADSDYDGYGDAEELARNSNPLFSGGVPEYSEVSVGVAAASEGGDLHIITAIYLQDGVLHDKDIHMGTLYAKVVSFLPKSVFAGDAQVTILPAREAGELVVVFDSALESSLVRRAGSLSFFSAISQEGFLVSADSALVRIIDEEIVWRQPLLRGPGADNTSLLPTPQQGAGAVYRPLGGSMPANWQEDQICLQKTMVVGVVGAVILQEVVSADCDEGWDAYCPPSCKGTVGSTVEILDPAVLIGG